MAQADITGSLPSCTEIIDVSRTVQSSDLFTPYREPRVTLPTIGFVKRRHDVIPLAIMVSQFSFGFRFIIIYAKKEFKGRISSRSTGHRIGVLDLDL